MKQPGVVFHGALLLASTALAWWAWNDVEAVTTAGTGPVLAEIEAKDIEQVDYRWPEGELSARPLPDGEDIRWAVTLHHEVEELPAKKPEATGEDAGPAADAGPAPAPKKKKVTERFPGGRQLVRSMEKLAPLKARRSLGVVDAERLKKLGLAEPERKLVVKANGKSFSFDVGDATYGDQARYVRLDGKDEVLLLEAAAVRGLEGKVRRLMEARLVPVPLADVTGFEVELGESRAAFDHADREQPKLRHFVVRGSTDQRSEEAQGLMATLRGLRSTGYVELALVDGKPQVGALKLLRGEAPPVLVVIYEEADGAGYLIQTGGFIGKVPSSRGKNLMDDLTAVMPLK